MAIGELPIRRRSRFSFIIPSLTLLMGSTWNYNRAVCTKYLLVMTDLLMKHHVNLFGQETLSLLLVPVEVTQYFPSVFLRFVAYITNRSHIQPAILILHQGSTLTANYCQRTVFSISSPTP